MAIKEYKAYCITKANGHKYMHHSIISAESAKDARKAMCTMVEVSTGRHAFTPSTGKPGGEWYWDKVLERHNISERQMDAMALARGGWCFA